jgi:Ca-activated chloride channel family protein
VVPEEDRLPRESLAAALRAPKVVREFLVGEPLAFHAFTSAGEHAQAALLPGWQIVGSEQDLVAVVGTMARTERTRFFSDQDGAAVGDALVHAAGALLSAPTCNPRTIDVAGDGVSNQGLDPELGCASPQLEGVTVKAAIVRGRGMTTMRPRVRRISGPGSRARSCGLLGPGRRL